MPQEFTPKNVDISTGKFIPTYEVLFTYVCPHVAQTIFTAQNYEASQNQLNSGNLTPEAIYMVHGFGKVEDFGALNWAMRYLTKERKILVISNHAEAIKKDVKGGSKDYDSAVFLQENWKATEQSKERRGLYGTLHLFAQEAGYLYAKRGLIYYKNFEENTLRLIDAMEEVPLTTDEFWGKLITEQKLFEDISKIVHEVAPVTKGADNIDALIKLWQFALAINKSSDSPIYLISQSPTLRTASALYPSRRVKSRHPNRDVVVSIEDICASLTDAQSL